MWADEMTARVAHSLESLAAEVAEVTARSGLLSSTASRYSYRWRYFCRWCEVQHLAVPASSETVGLFLLAHDDLAHSSLRSMICAIAWGHRTYHHTDPTGDPGIANVMSHHAREHGTAPRPVDAATANIVARLLEATEDPHAGSEYWRARIRSMLTISYLGALRGQETCMLRGPDILVGPDGTLAVRLRQTKSSPGKSVTVVLDDPSDPRIDVRASLRRLADIARALEADLSAGHLFRPLLRVGHARSLPDRPVTRPTYHDDVARLARFAGLDREGLRLGTHSMRRGWATDAAAHGSDVVEIRRHGRWVRIATPQSYVVAAAIFDARLQVDY